jgi:uncharacterized protein (UPF0147 family)
MRNATMARLNKETLRKRGIRVVAIQQGVSDDPNGHFAEGVFELIDQLESETKLDSAIVSHIAEHVFSAERCHEILREFVEDQGIPRQKTAEQRRLLERERDELGKRLDRWYERIETDSELGDVGAERLRELKAKRDEVVRTLAKLKPMHSVPPYLYKPETIQRFQARLREAFLGVDRATARVYLQNLVDHIVVGEDEIIIEARAGAALAMMSAPGSSSPKPPREKFSHTS